MSLTLAPATELRIQQQLADGHYDGPDALITHALELVAAEQTERQDWLVRNRDAIRTAVEESSAQAARGEGYSPEEARTLLAEHRARRMGQAA